MEQKDIQFSTINNDSATKSSGVTKVEYSDVGIPKAATLVMLGGNQMRKLEFYTISNEKEII